MTTTTIDSFLTELAAVAQRHPFHIDETGGIRDDDGWCPICSVLRARGVTVLTNSRAESLAKANGMEWLDAVSVVYSADCIGAGKLRHRLMVACGLTKIL